MTEVYKAHINQDTGEVQTVKEHCEGTARICEAFAVPELKALVRAMGIAHDVGKFQPSFQRRINNENIRVEHSTCGAIAAEEKYKPPISIMMKYCIAGHHSGLPDAVAMGDSISRNSLDERMKRTFEDFSEYKNQLILPEIDLKKAVEFIGRDCTSTSQLVDKFSFLTRYCFSCLVDADSIDTGTFCGTISNERLTADFRKCLEKVNERLEGFKCETELQKTRKLLQQQVFDKTDSDSEIYLMNMPTGSGKTLCSIKFALEKAVKENKKRIIYVIPYNSIIDQTVSELEDTFGEHADILRHQSSFSYEDEEDTDENYKRIAKAAAENWDAPLIVTTAVQFFESLHSNRRGKLRKMHNIADSILIFDEAHLMPQDYLQPCLQVIAYAAKYLNSKAVLLTATMPDFEKLVKKYALPSSSIMSLVEDKEPFSKFDKCKFVFLGEAEEEEILIKAYENPTSLVIVNSKKRAKVLYRKCSGKKFHLSTYLTSLDRKRIIDQIKKELCLLEKDYPGLKNVPDERRITIISTSLIEAGVDIDVSAVFRELTGLDSILQSGGRCNREGKREGAFTYVFSFPDSRFSSVDERSNLTRGIFKKYENVASPESIAEYYDRWLFIRSDNLSENTMSKLCGDIKDLPFKTYADKFKIIKDGAKSVVVPVDENCRELMKELRYKGKVSGRKFQKYTATVSESEFKELFKQGAIEDFGTGIWCLGYINYYDENEGIRTEPSDCIL